MTQETLLQIGKLGLAIEDGANMVLDMYRVKEELTGEDLFKGEPRVKTEAIMQDIQSCTSSQA